MKLKRFCEHLGGNKQHHDTNYMLRSLSFYQEKLSYCVAVFWAFADNHIIFTWCIAITLLFYVLFGWAKSKCKTNQPTPLNVTNILAEIFTYSSRPIVGESQCPSVLVLWSGLPVTPMKARALTTCTAYPSAAVQFVHKLLLTCSGNCENHERVRVSKSMSSGKRFL